MSRDLNEEVHDIWNENAEFWDQQMSDEGNQFQRFLVGPTSTSKKFRPC